MPEQLDKFGREDVRGLMVRGVVSVLRKPAQTGEILKIVFAGGTLKRLKQAFVKGPGFVQFARPV